MPSQFSQPVTVCNLASSESLPRSVFDVVKSRHLRTLVPATGLHADGRVSYQSFSSGVLLIEGPFQVDNPRGDA